jgi:hypothetical protein
MKRKTFLVGLASAVSLVFIPAVTPLGTAHAQDDARIAKAMQSLKAKAAQLGPPRVEGMDAVGGKEVPALYFGSTKVNNSFDLVDAVGSEDKGMTATFFVKHGEEFVRVSTSVPKPDGSGRAIGTVLDPAGKAIAQIRQGKPFYGEVPILGVPYMTGYEPMTDATGKVIGVYYVGYKK